ncbi:MAG: polyphosphate polymerase domain-containing protein [Eubacteriales bacterium]|nr:polyphosphate polymerase domain-containing protein [Eubacteriales bacterium]
MDYISNFQRIEKKYLLRDDQLEAFLPRMAEYMEADSYGESTICNLYLDTADDLLVRRSLEKPKYKEKMRLRSYGVPEDDGVVFLEIKKKSGGVVYKRRIALTAAQAMAYLTERQPLPRHDQISREIDYMVRRYGLYPKLYLAYDRIAYREILPGENGVRITIDHHIRSRESDIDLLLGDAGKLLLPKDISLMEIKIAGAYPLWLANALSEALIFPTSFSKYGRVYQEKIKARSTLAPRTAAQNRTVLGGLTHAFSPV